MSEATEKLVEVYNHKNFQHILKISDDERDSIVFPPRGRITMKLNQKQIENLNRSNLRYNLK